MNKFESKFYHTALLMNQALVKLLNEKDYEFITIKEICKKAGVNRSTFYLHYDNINQLLEETIENINKSFLSYFEEKYADFQESLNNDKKENLVFITPHYLHPYLTYIKENKEIYQIAVKYPIAIESTRKYDLLRENIIFPVLKRFHIEESERKYFSTYFIHGIYAIIEEWIKDKCQEDIDKICNIIIKCVNPFEKKI